MSHSSEEYSNVPKPLYQATVSFFSSIVTVRKGLIWSDIPVLKTFELAAGHSDATLQII